MEADIAMTMTPLFPKEAPFMLSATGALVGCGNVRNLMLGVSREGQ